MLDLISASLGSPTFRAVAPQPDKINLGDATLPDGTKMIGPGGFLAPAARQFSMIVNAATRMYSYRFDEAMRDNFVAARAMRRDAFIRGLMEERILPTINRSFQLEVDDDRDPSQVAVRDALLKIVRAIPDFDAFKRAQLDAVWFGRAGCQWGFKRSENHNWAWGIPRWDPIHGDSVQFTFDGIPAILLDAQTVGWYAQHGATYGPVGKGDLVPTDRGGTALVLHRPYWRDRFSIHRHILEKADYFEGELAGSSQGLGIRGLIYWQYVVRTDALTWMLAYMQAVGQMDLLVFNYPNGDAEAKLNQENNARKIIGKAAIACPRNPNGNWPAVEQIQMNSAGLKALHDLVADYFDRHIERIIVGQSMSSGADKGDGLGGTGRAEFAKACVPVEGSEILTRAGFKSPEDVQVGEEVLAYDADADRCRWTPLLKKSFFEDCPIVRMHTEQNRFEAVCTPDHSWAVEATAYGSDGGESVVGPRGGVKPAAQKRFLQKAHDLRPRDNIVLAAREDETAESLLTPTEAAILGWVVTDGTVRRYDGKFSGTRYSVGICQSKESNFETIRKLMVEYTGTTHETVVETKQRTFPMNGVTYTTKPQHWWYLPRELGTWLLKKAGFWDRSDLPGIVTRLSGPARKAMLDAMLSADGYVGSQIVFTNTDPHVIEALEILCALEGLATGATRAKPRDGRYKTCFDKGIKTTRLAYGAHIQQEDVGTADVWCPTTKYGTWVMRQNGRVMVTGNTKDEILIYDTNRLDATLTTNLIEPLKKYNYGKAKFPVRFKSILPNLEAENKVSSGLKLIQVGVPIKVDELRDAAGYSRPDQGDDVIGMPQPMMPPGAMPPGGAPPGAGGPPMPAGPAGPGAVYSGGGTGVAHQLPPGAAPPPVAFSDKDRLPLRGPIMPISAVEKYPAKWPQQYQKAGALVRYDGAAPAAVGTWPNQYYPGGSNTYLPKREDEKVIQTTRYADRDGFEAAIDADPLEATNHLVFADWLDENGASEEAEFRRNLAEWLRDDNTSFRHQPSEQHPYHWTVALHNNTNRYPRGVGQEHMPAYVGAYMTEAEPHVPRMMGGSLRWDTYRGMERAMWQAFQSANRQRAAEGGQYARVAAPTAYDEPKYASTQVNLTGPACIKVASLAWAIPDEDLHEKGRESEPHVTVRYGLHTDDAQEVAAVLAGCGPVTLTLGKVSYFAPEGKDYDVVKVDVTSPDLKKLNAKLGALKNTQTYSYKPHATVAYVKRGLGKKWADVFGPADIEFVADAIVFSPKDRQNKTFITLDPHAKVPEGAKQLTAYRRPTAYDTGPYDANATRRPDPMLDRFKPLDLAPESPDELPTAAHVPHLGHPTRAYLSASPVIRAAPVGHPDEDDDMDDEDAARPGMSESWRLHYPDRSGAIFKPGRGEPPLRRAILPGTGHRREVAASVAADILGLGDLVPHTSFRSLEGRNGSVQQWLPGLDTGFNAPHRIRFGGTPEETARAAAFDYLIGHADRHKNNWLVDPDTGRLKLIDNGLSFPKFHTAQDFRNRELLNMAVKGGYKLPDEVKDYGRHWDELEHALRGLGIEDDAVKLTKQRLGHLVNKWHHKFTDLPAHWL